MQRVSEIARDVIKNIDENTIAYGCWSELHAIYDRAWPNYPDERPIKKWQKVLNALDSESKRLDAIFEKRYFRAHKGLARAFVLKSGHQCRER
jgi:hypothetical protein